VPDNVLGLGVVTEDEADEIGHWVVFVGRTRLNDIGLSCAAHWNGIILDSHRGYKCWRVGTDPDSGLHRITILTQRNGNSKEIPVYLDLFIRLRRFGLASALSLRVEPNRARGRPSQKPQFSGENRCSKCLDFCTRLNSISSKKSKQKPQRTRTGHSCESFGGNSDTQFQAHLV
jgi:hypothetical protein